VLGSLFDAGYRSHMIVSGLPHALAAKAKESFAVALRLPEPIAGHARDAFASGLHISLLAGAGAALAAAIGSFLLLASGRELTPADTGASVHDDPTNQVSGPRLELAPDASR
jgi:hypothetical protein